MTCVAIQARTAVGFRRLRRRNASSRDNTFISRGYNVPGAAVGPKSYRRPPAGSDSNIPRPLTKREHGLGQRLPIACTGGVDVVAPGATTGCGTASHLGRAVHFGVPLE